MMMWLLVLVLMAGLAALGYRQGGVRVSFSLIGIVVAALVAGPLGKMIRPALGAFGLKNPTLMWVVAPFIVFIVVSMVFKAIALAVHHKIDVHFRYKAGDLRQVLWERLNSRLGLCLGLVNGALYAILLSFVIFSFGYWTVQAETADSDAWIVRQMNGLARAEVSTGFAKVARAIDPMAQSYYDAADVAGLLYNNPLLEARLGRYPGFLGLAERPEIADIGNDSEFTNMRLRREPFGNLLDYSRAQTILQNPDLLNVIWTTALPDLGDLREYLLTGKTAKYENEKILGRWNFDVNGAMLSLAKLKPNMPVAEKAKMKKYVAATFTKISMVATPEKQMFLKNAPAPIGPQPVVGQWESLDGGKYLLTFTVAGQESKISAVVEGDRLTPSPQGIFKTPQGFGYAFLRED